MIATMFATTAKRLGLTGRHDDHNDDQPTTFRRPAVAVLRSARRCPRTVVDVRGELTGGGGTISHPR